MGSSGKNTINGDNTLYKKAKVISGGGGSVDTDFTIYGSGTAIDPLGVNYNRNKTIFVDATYGDDLTAEKYQPLKAYQNINTAYNNAVNGDVIYVRM
jgi:hypothetical protein